MPDAPTARTVLGAESRPRPPFPRWLLGVWVVGLIVFELVDQLVDDQFALTLAAGAVPTLGAIGVAMWLEGRVHHWLGGHRPVFRLVGAAALPVLALATTPLLFLILALTVGEIEVNLGGGLLLTSFVFSLWLAGAAAGSFVIVVLDVAVSAVVPRFRDRVLLAVSILAVLGALLAYAGAVLLTDLGHRMGSGESFGSVNINEDDGSISTTHLSELFARDPSGLATLVFFFGVLLILPAAVSAAGKLADAVMERIHPLTEAFTRVAAGDRAIAVEEAGSQDFRQLAEQFNAMVTALDLGERMERAFGTYVSPQLLGRIRARHGEAAIPPEKRVATVFFADIRGFTSMSERLEAEEVAAVLNRYFERVVAVIERWEGYLDKFIGDAVVVVFNGPVDQVDHAERAARCAVEMQRALEEMNAAGEFAEVGGLAVGIGIVTGPLFCGNIGGVGQMEYTVIGDTVNLAARLTGLAPGGEVWVSAETAAELPADLAVTELPPVAVKGKAEPVVPSRVGSQELATIRPAGRPPPRG